MTVLDVMRLTLNNGIKSSDPEAARLLASPEAKKVGATDLNRKGKVMELEPPDIHFLFFWEAWEELRDHSFSFVWESVGPHFALPFLAQDVSFCNPGWYI